MNISYSKHKASGLFHIKIQFSKNNDVSLGYAKTEEEAKAKISKTLNSDLSEIERLGEEIKNLRLARLALVKVL